MMRSQQATPRSPSRASVHACRNSAQDITIKIQLVKYPRKVSRQKKVAPAWRHGANARRTAGQRDATEQDKGGLSLTMEAMIGYQNPVFWFCWRFRKSDQRVLSHDYTHRET